MSASACYRWVTILIAIAGLSSCYWYERANRARLESTSRNLQSCQALAAKITQFRHSPHKARLATRSSDDLASLIEKAASDAQLASDRVVRIDPQPAKRIGKTDYLNQATEVELVNISLRQLVSFLFNLATSESDLGVSILRLQVPHNGNSASTELWLADIVLTQRVYAPTNRR